MSDTPKVCDSDGCANEGEPLTPCECLDGEHSQAGESEDEAGEVDLDKADSE